jgi:hypothetical protein
VEFVIMVPLFAAVAAMVMFVTYICWQGVKTQQAANLAARIAGQETVGGAQTFGDIDRMNGVQNGVTNNNNPNPLLPNGASVYNTYSTKVQALLNIHDTALLRAFPPSIGLGSTEVKVIRSISFPAVFFLSAQQITIGDDRHVMGSVHYVNAYGGEDTFMFGLPRWGGSGLGQGPYWQNLMTRLRAQANASASQYN